MTTTFSIRLQYGELDASCADLVEILGAPSLGPSRVAASTLKGKTQYGVATPERFRALITSEEHFDLSLESAGEQLENRISLALRPRMARSCSLAA